jgi:hypothetical protein
MMAGVALQAAAANPSDSATLIELVLSAMKGRSSGASLGLSGGGCAHQSALRSSKTRALFFRSWQSGIGFVRDRQREYARFISAPRHRGTTMAALIS